MFLNLLNNNWSMHFKKLFCNSNMVSKNFKLFTDLIYMIPVTIRYCCRWHMYAYARVLEAYTSIVVVIVFKH